ncbi:cell proliferation protein CDC123 [Aspergillus novofumigatus IBT 16806]|uniref:Cell cycle control protein Cdc123 n=1 Tax=Aspergillus novofumigatus (strain IBT 16806) TaxID=1392255 RepID=A0A2I1CE43_ASPN1|nr:cell cycle control protein Cdc123 [Aspergillus novofumigatus IBT 16806]PKX95901.1 cell cycle control protein Cdc123 [Aspergillus novofumigatus IBT 16806]
MPLLDPDTQAPAESSAAQPQRLPFPPVTYSHILHCSYHYWQPRYRTLTPKSRAIPLTPSFVSYLRADGIVLPPETTKPQADDDLDTFSDDGADEEPDPSVEWQEIHSQIKSTISEFGGKVTPKLNWSAPKDAVWMSATNDLQCRTPNDIYLLLKSSDFITHDLEHPFDDCVPDTDDSSDTPATQPDIPYHLVLRKYVNFNPSLEFRCFVRNRMLLCMCQRDQNHFDFLFSLRDTIRSRIQAFFDDKLKDTFPDPNFVFDVYIPEPHRRVWLIDINPWADRTDPLLFSWMEILQMKDPIGIKEEDADAPEESFVRLSLNGANPTVVEVNGDEGSESEEEDVGSADDGDDSPFLPEFRLVKRDDPEAYSFSTPQYSAHKLPREVVDASLSGPGGMSEFLGKWQDILAKQTQEDTDSDDGR